MNIKANECGHFKCYICGHHDWNKNVYGEDNVISFHATFIEYDGCAIGLACHKDQQHNIYNPKFDTPHRIFCDCCYSTMSNEYNPYGSKTFNEFVNEYVKIK